MLSYDIAYVICDVSGQSYCDHTSRLIEMSTSERVSKVRMCKFSCINVDLTSEIIDKLIFELSGSDGVFPV